VSSALTRVECLRAIEGLRSTSTFDDATAAERRAGALAILAGMDLAAVSGALLERAADPFPVSLATLDAIHLATAIELRQELGSVDFATHDLKLAATARSVGFEIIGGPQDC